MSLYEKVDFRILERLVNRCAQEARQHGFAGHASRWCDAADDGSYLRRLVLHVADLIGLDGDPAPGFVLLDAGGGSGLLSVIACLMGASRAIVLDTNSQMFRFLRRVLPTLRFEVTIETHLRDVSRSGLPDDSVDVALCNEALSHMVDIDGFLGEVRRVLRPGGRLVISDSNNEANPRVRRARVGEWERFERPFGNGTGPGEILSKRCDLISRNHPGLALQHAQRIAAGTCGMTGDQVLLAAERFLEAGIPPSSYFDGTICPVDPLSNQCADRLFEPYDLGRLVSRHGLKASVRAHFATRPPYRALNGIWSAMTPITLPLSRAFRIVAVKTGGAGA